MFTWTLYKFLRWCSGIESVCQWRRDARDGFNPWVGKIPWKRKWQSTPVLLSGIFHGQRSLVAFSPWGHKKSDVTDHTHTHTQVNEFQINQQKSNLNHQNREANSHRKRIPQHCQKFILFLSAFSKIAYNILPVWQLSGERKILTLSLDTISKLTPIPGDCKHYCSPPVRIESYRNELKFFSKWSSDSMNP